MPANTSDSSRANSTVKGHFTSLCEAYTVGVLNTTLASTDPVLLAEVRHLLVELEEFWRHLSSVGAFSANDELDDYSTTALEMLWTPYMIADLYQRIQGPSRSATTAAVVTSSATGDGGERMHGEEAMRHGEGPGNSESGAAAPLSSPSAAGAARLTASSLREGGLRSLTRQEALARAHAWLKAFFEWMENVELVDEKTLDAYSVYRSDQRTKRIELSRTLTTLKYSWKTAEDKVAYMHAKRRRMQVLMEADGDTVEETGGEEEEVLRDRALARLRWSIYEGCHQLQLSSRELSMLEALSPDQRTTISQEYQATMDAVRRGELSLGRHTYTILPDGMMAAGTVDHPQQVRTSDILQSGGITAPLSIATTAPSMALSAQANQLQYRQQVRKELQVDRNQPTMTLQEFAATEMAEIQRQMDEAQVRQQSQAEEDERVGPDGVEERKRQKDAAWDDWKDDHPAFGITNKGNYS